MINNKLNLPFEKFDKCSFKDSFVTTEDWKENIVFILKDFTFVNGTVICKNGIISVFEKESTEDNPIEYYMIKY